MPFAAAEHDEVGAAVPRDAQDLGLDVAGVDEALGLVEPGPCGQLGDAPRRALDQFVLDLHRRQQRLAHRLDRHELDDVQQRSPRAP